jgi:hypothetical protein
VACTIARCGKMNAAHEHAVTGMSNPPKRGVSRLVQGRGRLADAHHLAFKVQV